MTNSEFLEWWKHAIASFAVLHRVFPERTAEAGERFKVWRNTLVDVPLDAAKAAIDAMHRGDFEAPKYDWDQLPAYVLRYCKQEANIELAQRAERYYDQDGPTFRCPHCQDSRSGMVSIWNPWFVNTCDQELLQCQTRAEAHEVFLAWKKQDPHRRRYETLAVPCCCDSPNAVVKRDRGHKPYDPKRHCREHSMRGLHSFLESSERYEMEF